MSIGVLTDMVYSFFNVYVALAIPFMAFLGLFSLSKQGENLHSVNFFVAFLVSAMFMLLRDPTAPNDYLNYKAMYESIFVLKDVFEAYHGNYFFSFVQYLGRGLGIPHEVFSLVLSAVCVLLAATAIYLIFDNKKYAVICFVMFSVTSTYILLFTNVIRQGLALSLFMLGVAFFVRKSYVKALLFILLSVYSHGTGLILVMVFLAAMLYKPEGRYRSILIIALPVLPLVGSSMMGLISGMGDGFGKIDRYSDYEYDNALVYIKAGLLYIFFVFLCWLERRGFFKEGGEIGCILLNAYSYILVVVFLSLPVLIISSRFLYYASSFMPFFFALIVVQFKYISITGKAVLFVVGFCLYGCFSFFFPSTAAQLGLF